MTLVQIYDPAMQEIVCPMCESGKSKPIFWDCGYDKKKYKIVRCLICGFCYLNPQPSEQDLDAIYSQYYGTNPHDERTSQHLSFRAPLFEDICDTLQPYQKPKGKLLDIGCGTGDFIYLASKRGWDVSGIEISKPAIEYATKQRHLNVVAGSFYEIPFSENSFDVVTLLDVLEHLFNPLTTLNSIYKILKPGGILLIRVPNTPFQLLKAKVQRFRKGKHFTTLATPLHLNHFDSASLTRAVEKARFHVNKIYPGGPDGTGTLFAAKKLYSLLSHALWVAANKQVGNALCLVAMKPALKTTVSPEVEASDSRKTKAPRIENHL